MISFQGNWIDLVIIVFILSYVLLSFDHGFLSEFFETLGFIISLFAGLTLFPFFAPIFIRYFTIPHSFANAIGFFTAWIIVETIYFIVIKKLFKMIPDSFIDSKWNRYLVVFPSIISSLVLIGFILTLFIALPTPPRVKKQVLESEIGGRVVKIASKLDKPIDRAFGQAIQDSLTFVTVRPESHEKVDLGFTQKEFTVDEESETAMLALVNKERQSRGLSVLTFDSSLLEVGRVHAKDMFQRGYFSHFSPEGEDVGDRLDKEGVAYLAAGENLAFAPSVSLAHEGLMNSPGHRANILHTGFNKIGIGVIDGGIYGKMFTQVFTD